ncbi:GH25 family lysozyme [Leuconostoc falkenbergense]|uniref:GH25 family lysozyme n=1 Tax=Leuconostoc falkenbergense TaxID=2766470 RepID=UPI0024AD7D35|nr:GH25 family lysozyme [Leuconostoc falkenbergense]MDI6666871.1 GH25 family lysozyme [Leuconostoc falkenbergense]
MRKSSIIVSIIVAIATALSFKSNLAYAADGIPAITAGAPGLPRMDVVDVSSNNGNISVASFKKMHQYGVNAVIVKLTEATSYRNPYAATQIANAKAAGLRIGAYHYSWYTSQSSAQSEAKYFTNYAKSLKLSSDTLMVDDLEDTYTMTNNVTSNAKAFNTQLKAAGFSNTSLYTGLYYKNTTGLNFSYIGNARAWIAQYPFTPSSTSLWNTTYGMWQWNSNTSFPGVSGTFDVSIDYTNLIKQSAKYKVGDVVRIASNAWSETNGYTLVNRQNWIGTVVSAKPNIYGNSAWEYDIQYPNGVHSVHVAEQDLIKK